MTGCKHTFDILDGCISLIHAHGEIIHLIGLARDKQWTGHRKGGEEKESWGEKLELHFGPRL
jgi:hypothetical protein